MRSTTMLMLFLLTAAGSEDREQQALMDRIEKTISLPTGAEPLNAYGRNYAFSGQDKVVATYLIPMTPSDPRDGCELMLEEFNSRPCSKEEVEQMSRSDARHFAAQTPAGKRRWYESAERLPYIYDGACNQVNVEYDIPSRRITTVSCNGHA